MESLQDSGAYSMSTKDEKKINRDVNKVVELEKRIMRGRCDPSLCSRVCPDCPMKLNIGRRKK